MKVSVNIPTYNRAPLIRHAIDSVLKQTYTNLEIIVIDDGSVDATPAVVAEYGDRVRYVRQANGGLGVARNAALDRSTGDCIAFLDSDDEWLDYKLAAQVATLERMPAVGCVHTEFVILKDDGSTIRRGSRTWLGNPLPWSAVYPRMVSSAILGLAPGAPAEFPIYAGNIYRQFLDEALVLTSTALVRRDAIGSTRFTERMTIFEDWEFFARVARDREVAFLDVEAAINRGHHGPRLTRCTALSKTQCYRQMVERVWMTDVDGAQGLEMEVRQAVGDALLAIAREALLASQPDTARDALARWRDLDEPDGYRRATAFQLLAGIPGGRQLLRGAVIGRKLVRTLAGRRPKYPVNPTV